MEKWTHFCIKFISASCEYRYMWPKINVEIQIRTNSLLLIFSLFFSAGFFPYQIVKWMSYTVNATCRSQSRIWVFVENFYSIFIGAIFLPIHKMTTFECAFTLTKKLLYNYIASIYLFVQPSKILEIVFWKYIYIWFAYFSFAMP